jgi:micrococcal nuclease
MIDALRRRRAGGQAARVVALAVGTAVVAAGGCDVGRRDEIAANGTTQVVRLIDGDTLDLWHLGRTRIIGVDAPEVGSRAECFGREAATFARRELPAGTRVRYELGVERQDRYGRALAYVYLPGRRLFAEVLAERGYAVQLTIAPNVRHAGRIRKAVARARRGHRGLWRACRWRAT